MADSCWYVAEILQLKINKFKQKKKKETESLISDLHRREDSEEMGQVEEGVAGGWEMVEGSTLRSLGTPGTSLFAMQASKWFEWKELRRKKMWSPEGFCSKSSRQFLSKPEAYRKEQWSTTVTTPHGQLFSAVCLTLLLSPKVDGVTFWQDDVVLFYGPRFGEVQTQFALSMPNSLLKFSKAGLELRFLGTCPGSCSLHFTFCFSSQQDHIFSSQLCPFTSLILGSLSDPPLVLSGDLLKRWQRNGITWRLSSEFFISIHS